MQNKLDMEGTATLIGNWTNDSIKDLNVIFGFFDRVSDDSGFNPLVFHSDFASDELTARISGEPNASLKWELAEWGFYTLQEGLKSMHEDNKFNIAHLDNLLRSMKEGQLLIFFYYLEESDIGDYKSSEPGNFVVFSDGHDFLVRETSGEEFDRFMALRQETGNSEVYEASDNIDISTEIERKRLLQSMGLLLPSDLEGIDYDKLRQTLISAGVIDESELEDYDEDDLFDLADAHEIDIWGEDSEDD